MVVVVGRLAVFTRMWSTIRGGEVEVVVVGRLAMFEALLGLGRWWW